MSRSILEVSGHRLLVEASAWPMSELADRLKAWHSQGILKLVVESGTESWEIGRYDGRWSWSTNSGKNFAPVGEALPKFLKSDSDALCFCLFRHSGEFCYNQAVSDFWQVHDLSWWRDFLDSVEALYPVASVLFE